MEHFGVKLTQKDKEFKLVRGEFAIVDTKPSLPAFQDLVKRNAYADEECTVYSEAWCNDYREICLKNYDLNMEFFSSLSREEFELSLDMFLLKYRGFKAVSDLNDYSGAEGYYLMVLDEYKQVYIGKTNDIKRRIIKHWSNTKPFDRTLFPMYSYDKSCFSIDFFRALDTTRLYVWKKRISDSVEAGLISDFPKQFCTNRIGGDVTNAIQAITTMRKIYHK